MVLKKKLLLILLLIGILVTPGLSFAQNSNFVKQMPEITFNSLPQNLPSSITQIINMLLYAVGEAIVYFILNSIAK